MGLFDKKICDICGEKIGLLGNRKLDDGNLCKDCAKKLSPWFEERRHSTVEDIKRQLEYREKNKKAVMDFCITRQINTRNYNVFIDDNKGNFTVARKLDVNENPDIVPLSAIVQCRVDVDQQQQDHPKNRQHPTPYLNKVLGHKVEQRDLAGLGGVLQHQFVHPLRRSILDTLVQYGEEARISALGNAEADFTYVLVHARSRQGLITALREQLVGHIDVRINRVRVAPEQRIKTFPHVLVKNDFLAGMIRRHMLREPIASLQGYPFDGLRLLGPHQHDGRPQVVAGRMHLVSLVPEVIPRYGADKINEPFLELPQRLGLTHRLKTEAQSRVF